MQCDECWAIRGTENQMNKDRLVHQRAKILKCRVCFKVFDDDNHKTEHKDMHVIGNKHYLCGEVLADGSISGSHYSGKGSMKLHMRKVHRKGLLKSKYTRKPENKIIFELLDDYKKKLEKSQPSTTFSILNNA